MLAQVPNATAHEVGDWLIPFAAVMGIVLMGMQCVNAWRRMFRKPRKRGPSPIEQRVTAVEKNVNDLKLEMAVQPAETRKMIDASIGPLQAKMDRLLVAVAAIAVKVGVPAALAHPEEGPVVT